MIKLIIFDFDGTVANTWKVVEDALKEGLGKYGYNLTKKLLNVLGNFPIEETLEIIIKNNKRIKEISLDFVAKKEKNFKKVKRVKNLEALKRIKVKKIILSNNVTLFIRKVLDNLKIDFFDEVYGADKFDNKLNKFREIIKKRKLKPREIMYVGDKPIDVKLARKIGCVSVAVSQKESWSSREELLNSEPDFIISDLKELKNIVENFK